MISDSESAPFDLSALILDNWRTVLKEDFEVKKSLNYNHWDNNAFIETVIQKTPRADIRSYNDSKCIRKRFCVCLIQNTKHGDLNVMYADFLKCLL